MATVRSIPEPALPAHPPPEPDPAAARAALSQVVLLTFPRRVYDRLNVEAVRRGTTAAGLLELALERYLADTPI